MDSCIKFYLMEKNRDDRCAEILKVLLEAHGEECPSQATVYRWFANKDETSPQEETKERSVKSSAAQKCSADERHIMFAGGQIGKRWRL